MHMTYNYCYCLHTENKEESIHSRSDHQTNRKNFTAYYRKEVGLLVCFMSTTTTAYHSWNQPRPPITVGQKLLVQLESVVWGWCLILGPQFGGQDWQPTRPTQHLQHTAGITYPHTNTRFPTVIFLWPRIYTGNRHRQDIQTKPLNSHIGLKWTFWHWNPWIENLKGFWRIELV